MKKGHLRNERVNRVRIDRASETAVDDAIDRLSALHPMPREHDGTLRDKILALTVWVARYAKPDQVAPCGWCDGHIDEGLLGTTLEAACPFCGTGLDEQSPGVPLGKTCEPAEMAALERGTEQEQESETMIMREKRGEQVAEVVDLDEVRAHVQKNPRAAFLLAGSEPSAKPANDPAGLVELAIDSIRVDGGTQSRAEPSAQAVEEYAEKYRSGAEMPAVEVFHDSVDNWLADGFQRVEAAKRAGLTTIAANVRTGDVRAARLFAAGANATHGLRRTAADKRKAVMMLLADPEWTKWSDGVVAERCGVSREYVNRVRNEQPVIDHRLLARQGADGKVRHLPAPRPRAQPKQPEPYTCKRCGRQVPEGEPCPKCSDEIVTVVHESKSQTIAFEKPKPRKGRPCETVSLEVGSWCERESENGVIERFAVASSANGPVLKISRRRAK